MDQVSLFWKYLSIGLSVFASLLTIRSYYKERELKSLRLSLKQSQEQYQKIVLNLTQKVPVIEKTIRSAEDVLKKRFPKQVYYGGFYSLVFIVGILILHFLPKIIDTAEFKNMSFGNWIFLVFAASVFLGLPFFIRHKIIESLKGTEITNVKIHFGSTQDNKMAKAKK